MQATGSAEGKRRLQQARKKQRLISTTDPAAVVETPQEATIRQLRKQIQDMHVEADAVTPLLGRQREVERIMASLGSLPSVVDSARKLWTVALALAATKVAGDFVETGVFKGGTSIAMMRVLDLAPELASRRHFACDSFLGIPKPSLRDKVDGPKGDACATAKCSRAKFGRAGLWHSTRATFEENVRRFNVTTSRLRIVEGWFSETLPPRDLAAISFLRLDGDLYNSTRDAIERLEPLVTPGGFIYVDDYGAFRGCAAAIDEYRAAKGITSPMHPIAFGRSKKFQGLWWRKSVPESSLAGAYAPGGAMGY